MKNDFMFSLLLVSLVCGCNDCQSSLVAEQGLDVRRQLDSMLLTESSIRSMCGVRTNLMAVSDASARKELLSLWERKLLDIDMTSAKEEERPRLCVAVASVYRDHLIWAMQDLGFDSSAVWNARLRLLSWLDEKIQGIDHAIATCSQNSSSLPFRRFVHDYRYLVERRECLVESYEMLLSEWKVRRPDEMQAQTEAARRLSEMIGRTVREKRDIRRLGVFARQRDGEILEKLSQGGACSRSEENRH